MSQSLYQEYEGSRGEFLKLLLEQGEEPSFLRRARVVHDAWEEILQRCVAHRDASLQGPRMHIDNLAGKIGGDWSQLVPYLADAGGAEAIGRLYEEWKPRLPAVIKSSSPLSTIRTSLVRFAESAARFNRLWDKFLTNIDLHEVNRLRSDFNRYYPIEKAAAFDSEAMDRLGFTALDPATVDQLGAKFPPLTVPIVL